MLSKPAAETLPPKPDHAKRRRDRWVRLATCVRSSLLWWSQPQRANSSMPSGRFCSTPQLRCQQSFAYISCNNPRSSFCCYSISLATREELEKVPTIMIHKRHQGKKKSYNLITTSKRLSLEPSLLDNTVKHSSSSAKPAFFKSKNVNVLSALMHAARNTVQAWATLAQSWGCNGARTRSKIWSYTIYILITQNQ